MSRTSAQSNQKKLINKKASEFAFKSKLCGPISELSVLRHSLLFAEVSMISYLSNEQCNIAAGKLGFTDGKFFDGDRSQAYWFQNEHDSVVVFRWTEPCDWNDIRADAYAESTLAETVGKVNCGLKSEADEIWPQIEKELEKNTKKLWFCGHSLGGAMAKICSGRCMLSYIKSEPEALFTFGSPRVGCKRYVNHVKLEHFRWVNKNDIVTRVPPVRMGYRHSGNEMHLDRLGHLQEMNGWRRMKNQLQRLFAGVGRSKIGQFSDHAVVSYIDNIFKILRAKESKTGTQQSAKKDESATSDTEASSKTKIDNAESSVPIESKKQLSA